MASTQHALSSVVVCAGFPVTTWTVGRAVTNLTTPRSRRANTAPSVVQREHGIYPHALVSVVVGAGIGPRSATNLQPKINMVLTWAFVGTPVVVGVSGCRPFRP